LLSLSASLPVQAIDPEIHKLIDQGPERRRRWLDWLVFHVEPTFAASWAKFQRALKQRNAALKSGADPAVWDGAMVEHGDAITTARAATLKRISPYLEALLARFPSLDVTTSFHAGWAHDVSLTSALQTYAQRDRERATSTVGPHRADVVLRHRGRSARETLSRGQQKLTAIAMVLAQLKLLKGELGTRATLLLDDPAAELDEHNLSKVFEELATLECQMIATSLSPEIALFQAPNAVFHVEHGDVLRV
jgi:DNA replication and repair protein RecF